MDDDPEIVELFVDVLERDGRFEVKTASTGYDAGMITQEFMPDLIILDYMLPDINGNVVCQTIRKNPNFEHMKIIIVSGVVNQDEINDLLKAGADEFVKKPFNIEKLIERIGELCPCSPARSDIREPHHGGRQIDEDLAARAAKASTDCLPPRLFVGPWRIVPSPAATAGSRM